MARKHLSAFVVMRIDARTEVDSLLGQLPLLPQVPIHWTLPSCLVSGSAADSWLGFLRELAGRRPTDVCLPLGYSGAAHPLLQTEELRRELDWGIHELEQALAAHIEAAPRLLARVLVCEAADLVRPEALRLYTAKGIRRLVLCAPDCWSAGGSLEAGAGRLEVLHAHPLDEVAAIPPRRLIGLPVQGLLGVLADAGSGAALADLHRNIAAHADLTYLRLDQELPIPSAPPSRGVACSDPICRARAVSVGSLRMRRQSSEETAGVLQVLAGLHGAPGPVCSAEAFPNPSRANTAIMLGAVSLSEGLLSAHFDAGRFAGLAWGSRPVIPTAPAASYVQRGRRRLSFEVTAAFALEAERLRGLRVLHRLPGEDASLILEYVFVEDFPYLLVSGRLRYPPPVPPESVCPLEIPVARLAGEREAAVHVLCRGEAAYGVSVSCEASPIHLAGSLFWFEGSEGGLLAGFPPAKEPVLDTVRLRLEQQQRSALLMASFFGTETRRCAPPTGLQVREELFSLYLGLAFEPPRSLPVFPRSVLEEIPFHAVSS